MERSSDVVVSVSLACSSSRRSLISQSMLEPASELEHEMYTTYKQQQIMNSQIRSIKLDATKREFLSLRGLLLEMDEIMIYSWGHLD